MSNFVNRLLPQLLSSRLCSSSSCGHISGGRDKDARRGGEKRNRGCANWETTRRMDMHFISCDLMSEMLQSYTKTCLSLLRWLGYLIKSLHLSFKKINIMTFTYQWTGWRCYRLKQFPTHCIEVSLSATLSRCLLHSVRCMQTCPLLNLFTGRKRKWFKVDEAIRVLQSHKPVHAEYLRRLEGTCNPTCTPVCDPANGNALSSRMTADDAPHYVVCSTHCSDLVSR